MNLNELSLRQVSKMFKNRKVSAMEIMDTYLNFALKGSCITFLGDELTQKTKDFDKRNIYKKELSPVAALPFSLKDNICVEDVLTTCNSRSLKEYVPTRSATIANNLMKNGAILTAKNCMREFSVGRLEDSAFEIRNYLLWSGTNANVNVGAFSIGTDIGMSEYFCSLWSLRLCAAPMKGIISGAPSLEKPTLITKKADDLSFLYPFINNTRPFECDEIIPGNTKVLVYNEGNQADYLVNFLSSMGFIVSSSDFSFLDGSEIIYEMILCTEFFSNLFDIGETDKFENCIQARTEGFGFETKMNIIKGAFLMSEKCIERTTRIIDSKMALVKKIYEYLGTYDFIAAPVIYDDKLAKASAMANLAELTVPFGDVLSFKVMTETSNLKSLLDLADYLETLI